LIYAPYLEKTMKKIIALALAAGATGSALAQPSIGVSIGINQPGVYGRIDLGTLPMPALVLPQPVIIMPPPVAVPRRPIYLYVPPAHQQDWRRYCGHYSACGQPVYFVQDRWVRERYEHEHPGWERGRHEGHDKHDDDKHGKGHGKDHRD
jgi:hypothetical protein